MTSKYLRSKLVGAPLTSENWGDFEELFGPRGACGGCWCMTWRLKSSDYEKLKGDQNRRAMRGLVNRGAPTGVLAYYDNEPIGWCAVAPREVFTRLNRSPLLKPIDNEPVWSIVCLFVKRPLRRKGVSRFLIRQASAYAKTCGATIVEAYPIEPRRESMPDLFAFTGIADVFKSEGFVEVARRQARPILRLYLK